MPAGSLDRWPEDYERGRPGWPPQVVDVAGLLPAASVLDLGAGTGKLTRLLVQAFDRVAAVEPAEAMRRLLGALCPEAEALAGTAQKIPLADASVDAVFAAESFHWFDDRRPLAEIARVLRPGGVLVLMWNLPAGPWRPSIAVVEQLLTERGPKPGEVSYDPLDLGGPRYVSGEWRLAFAQSSFEPLQEGTTPESADARPGRAWCRFLPRWAGSPTFGTKTGCRCWRRSGRFSPLSSTGSCGRPTSTGRDSDGARGVCGARDRQAGWCRPNTTP